MAYFDEIFLKPCPSLTRRVIRRIACGVEGGGGGWRVEEEEVIGASHLLATAHWRVGWREEGCSVGCRAYTIHYTL